MVSGRRLTLPSRCSTAATIRSRTSSPLMPLVVARKLIASRSQQGNPLSISKEDIGPVNQSKRPIIPSIAVCLLYFFMEDDKSPHLTCISLEIHRKGGLIRADELPVPLDEIMLSYQEVFGVSYVN
jgi:hypothetical protein